MGVAGGSAMLFRTTAEAPRFTPRRCGEIRASDPTESNDTMPMAPLILSLYLSTNNVNY